MFALGHFALGYLAGKGTAKLAHVKINLPLLLAASVIPDVDLLLNFMNHRGLTHSLITISIFSVLLFVVFKKTILPYVAAVLSHVLIGDFLTGGIELFWPISKEPYGLLDVRVNELPVALIELSLFILTFVLMYKLKDLQTLFKPQNHNLFLVISFGAVLGPLLWLGRAPDAISPLLIIPSIIWLCIFGYSMLIDLRFKVAKLRNHVQKKLAVTQDSPIK